MNPRDPREADPLTFEEEWPRRSSPPLRAAPFVVSWSDPLRPPQRQLRDHYLRGVRRHSTWLQLHGRSLLAFGAGLLAGVVVGRSSL